MVNIKTETSKRRVMEMVLSAARVDGPYSSIQPGRFFHPYIDEFFVSYQHPTL